MTNIQDDQNMQNQPKKADVDELLNQLEALNQEIAAKTVADQPQLEEKKDQPEKIEAPVAPPALEESDEPQLPSGDQEEKQKKDLDLDRFIDELEAKITEKDGGVTQEEEPQADESKPAEPQLKPAEPQLKPAEPQLKPAEPQLKPAEPQLKPVEAQLEPVETPVQPVAEPVIQEEQPNLQENFSRQRPSLDLSGVEEKPAPSLTLNNGQLEENQEDNKTELPKLTLDSEPTPQPSSEPSLEATPEPVLQPTPESTPEPTLAPAPAPEPAPASAPEPTPELNDEPVNEEDLESQNIFSMLGLENLEESEKEAFLADLEQLIWDNFIEVELPLLLNSEQKAQADQILADNSKAEDERKEALLVYVEEFIPNLEEVMYKKALSLKKEMFEERLKKMRDQATEENNLSLIADLDQIRELIAANRYKTATELLNKA